jgi:hypothetical protein
MPSVYDDEAFNERVNFAAKYISEGRRTTRHFDTCFEMNDGDVVATALWRRAEKNPKLAANLFRYIREDLTREHAEHYKSVKTRDLPAVARKLRRERREAWEQQLAELKG